MKPLYIAIAGLFLGICSSYGQTPTEHQEKLYVHTSKIQKHALKIKYGESRTKKEHKENVEEISKQLDSVVVENDQLKKSIPKRDREKVKNHTIAIEKHQLEAKKQTEALKTELSKDKHDEMAVRHHANRVHVSMEKIGKEQEIIKEKTAK